MQITFFVFVTLTTVCYATKVLQCPGGNIANLQNNVQIGECDSPPCKLKKNSHVPLTVKFVAEDEYKDLKLVVTADVAGVVLPFVGVDGSSPCEYIFEEDETTKVNNCRIEKGKTYVYKNPIEILQIYPRIKTIVHWSIIDASSANRKIVTCFEVPAAITN
uniref:MD-2-related lipid-recognition domain-containing protein n=1 Tax=Dendroctonus ponderosae TaxID=77166 RepID=A0AAR5QCW3_DENPD